METFTQPKITGYRQLTEADAEAINAVKHLGVVTEAIIERLKQQDADPRWVSIGTTHLQQGLMALTRAIAKPTHF